MKYEMGFINQKTSFMIYLNYVVFEDILRFKIYIYKYNFKSY